MNRHKRYPDGKKISERAQKAATTQEWIDIGFSPSGLMIATRERVMGKIRRVRR